MRVDDVVKIKMLTYIHNIYIICARLEPKKSKNPKYRLDVEIYVESIETHFYQKKKKNLVRIHAKYIYEYKKRDRIV